MIKLVTLRQALTDPSYYGLQLSDQSWLRWRVLLLAIMGEPLEPEELPLFQGLTGRPSAPAEPVREFAGIIWPPGREIAGSGRPSRIFGHLR
jgi:hypothetical protein